MTVKHKELLQALIEAADNVVACWASGDLAGAVNALESSANEARNQLEREHAERNKITFDDFKRINNDVNGNPRYVLHFLRLCTDAELDAPTPYSYEVALTRGRRAGGRKFHNKQYGGGIVFQSYSLDELCSHLNALREGN